MKACVLHGPGDVRLEEVAAPTPGPGDVRVAIAVAGICGSDLHRYRGLEPWGERPSYPRRDGHEIVGWVESLGEGARGLEVGQPVVIEPLQLAGCGCCATCRRGWTQLCTQRAAGPRRRSAGFAELDIAPRPHIHLVPPGMPLEVAVLADVYACAMHALHRVPLRLGEIALVMGTGALALALGQLLRLAGVLTLVAGRRAAALEAARRLGAADHTLEIGGEVDLSSQVLGITGGELAAAAFEAAGGRQCDAPRLAITALAPGGRMVILGAHEGEVRLPYREANRKEITLHFSNGYGSWDGRREISMALDLLSSGAVLAAPLVTHRFPLAAIAEAFAVAEDKAASGAIKVVVEPGTRPS